MQQIQSLKETIFRQTELITGVVTGAPVTIRLVLSSTNNEHWGPTGPQMRQISDATLRSSEDCNLVLKTIWERLSCDPQSSGNWRHLYKTLLLVEYILKNGSISFVNDVRLNVYHIKALTNTQHIDSAGVDRGVSIRERSRQIVDLLRDMDRLKEERIKAKLNRDKFETAYGSDKTMEQHYSSTRPAWKDSSLRSDDYPRPPKSDYEDDDYGENPSLPRPSDLGLYEDTPSVLTPPNLPSVTFRRPSTTETHRANSATVVPINFVSSDSTPSSSTLSWDPFGTRSSVYNPPLVNTTDEQWDDFNPRISVNVATAANAASSGTVSSGGALQSTVDDEWEDFCLGQPSSTQPKIVPIENIWENPVVTPSFLPTQSSLESNVVQNTTPKSTDPWSQKGLFDLSLMDKSVLTSPAPPPPTKSLNSTVSVSSSGVSSGNWMSTNPTPTVIAAGVPVGFGVPGTVYNPMFGTPVPLSSGWGGVVFTTPVVSATGNPHQVYLPTTQYTYV